MFCFLLSLIRAGDAGIQKRELGVMFRDLKVIGLGATVSYQPTLGSMLNPSNWLKGIQASRHPTTRAIISGFEGVVRPGEMLCKSMHLILPA